MQVSKDELAQRIADFTAACRHAGLRLTPQRRTIFEEVARSADHPDAAAVCRAVRERMPDVSLDTVYRTLWRLVSLGLVGTLGGAHESARFDANVNPHHHFICTRCGLTRDFDSAELDQVRAPAAAAEFGRASRVQVEVRGLCHRCLRAAGSGHSNSRDNTHR